MFKLKLQVGNLPTNRLALTNKIYVSNENLQHIANFYASHSVPPLANANGAYLISLNNHPFAVEGHPQVPNEQVGLNGLQRRYCQLFLATAVILQPLQPNPPSPLARIEFAVDTLLKSKSSAGADGKRAKP